MKLIWFMPSPYRLSNDNSYPPTNRRVNFARATKLLPLLLACLLLIQCNSRPRPSSGNDAGSLQNDTSRNTTPPKMDILLLSPNEILEEMLVHKKTLNAQLVNLPTNAPKYLDRKQQSLNLGVYLADFAYLNLGTDKTNSLAYFKIIIDLSQKINIYGNFDEAFFTRLQNNLTNNDSILSLSKEVYYSLASTMQETSLPDAYALMSSGAFIESLYLAVMNIPRYEEFKEAAQKIFEKKQLLESYYTFASAYNRYPDVKSVLAQLKTLKQILDESKITTTKTTIMKNKNNHLTVRGGDEIEVTEAAFYKLKQNVIKIRQDIVNTNSKK